MAEVDGIAKPVERDAPVPADVFLRPADGVEAPRLEVRGDAVAQPALARAVLLLPDFAVVGVLEIGFVGVIDADGDEGRAVGVHQPPALVRPLQAEVARRVEGSARIAAVGAEVRLSHSKTSLNAAAGGLLSRRRRADGYYMQPFSALQASMSSGGGSSWNTTR